MALQPPPPSLAAFPPRSRARTPTELFRISWAQESTTGAVNSGWRFSSLPPGYNRFDLPAPRGTCYWSDRRHGAWVEVFRGVTTVDSADAARRRLFVATPPPMRLADVLARRAYSFGVTAELSTTGDYEGPQRWAAAFARQGFHGVVGSCRHDPSSTALNVAVFGVAGTPAKQRGWRVQRRPLAGDTQLLRELVPFGVRVTPNPDDVPIIGVPG